jgi:hypothetical protein
MCERIIRIIFVRLGNPNPTLEITLGNRFYMVFVSVYKKAIRKSIDIEK